MSDRDYEDEIDEDNPDAPPQRGSPGLIVAVGLSGCLLVMAVAVGLVVLLFG